MIFESSLTNFLPMFCVQQLKWTKTSASYVASVFWGTFACGQLLCICFSSCLKPSLLLGLWISVGVSGLSISSMFPTLLTWTNSELLPVFGNSNTKTSANTCIHEYEDRNTAHNINISAVEIPSS
ncbi:hypothetical protein KUTeg_008391 [Tegillarca granosa]|uniref:Uncharacterized protein n=1 Tax=Tegillarca granosa TaxID=220873 RepID=A0ABQ9FDW4_TEGGR|nr:hypothetical protein KUTeg_008391 [Tegillarca granosa]